MDGDRRGERLRGRSLIDDTPSPRGVAPRPPLISRSRLSRGRAFDHRDAVAHEQPAAGLDQRALVADHQLADAPAVRRRGRGQERRRRTARSRRRVPAALRSRAIARIARASSSAKPARSVIRTTTSGRPFATARSTARRARRRAGRAPRSLRYGSSMPRSRQNWRSGASCAVGLDDRRELRALVRLVVRPSIMLDQAPAQPAGRGDVVELPVGAGLDLRSSAGRRAAARP